MSSDVNVFIRVQGTPSDCDDEWVAGTYQVQLQLPAGTDSAVYRSEMASAALDCFHEHVGIAVLDDFSIVATLADGTILTEEEGVPRLQFGSDFLGSL